MKRLTCIISLNFIILSSWACSCIGIHPINLASLYADQVVVAKISPQRPYSNAIEVKITQVLKGTAELKGQAVLLWQDFFECSSLPRIDSSQEFVFAFDRIEEEYLVEYWANSKELQTVSDSSSYKNVLTKLKAHQHFGLPGCSVSYIKMEAQMEVVLARKYKPKKNRIILRTRKRKLSREDFIQYLKNLEKI
ncbi:MAG: hypothetical protein R8P61_18015 [Bacteroidia bacterium]|nr:hypothetical protein [Bacteroidia bacterium]